MIHIRGMFSRLVDGSVVVSIGCRSYLLLMPLEYQILPSQYTLLESD